MEDDHDQAKRHGGDDDGEGHFTGVIGRYEPFSLTFRALDVDPD
jgi:hypothetical protein